MQTDEHETLDDATVTEILTRGELEVEGRLVAASNASFLGQVSLHGIALACIYKPVAGERPLWDFPSGTLAGREVSARLVSDAGGFGVVPPTVLRDGRFGVGMCQQWIHADPDPATAGDAVGAPDGLEALDLVDLVPSDFRDPGWIAVLEAEDNHDRPVLLVHADDDRLRTMAVLDAVINNADRKGGHVLRGPDGSVYGCDHGVSFHEEPKLRTVLWGWAGERLRDLDREMLRELRARCRSGLDDVLDRHLSRVEVNALAYRVEKLLQDDVMPRPEGHWPMIPWPAF